jgi:Zn-dependent peptidase ImmA (M78 family)
MTFIPEQQIATRAAEVWRRYELEPGFDVERLLDAMGLGLTWEPIADDGGSRVLGQLVPEQNVVLLNENHLDLLEEKEGRLRRYTVGHEIGHWLLHAADIRAGTLSLFDGKRIWCRDGSQDPVERQAEMFSASLLMPRDRLLAALPQPPWNGWPAVYRLADAFMVNVTPMAIRLETCGWMHRDDQGVPVSGPRIPAGQGSLFSI